MFVILVSRINMYDIKWVIVFLVILLIIIGIEVRWKYEVYCKINNSNDFFFNCCIFYICIYRLWYILKCFGFWVIVFVNGYGLFYCNVGDGILGG